MVKQSVAFGIALVLTMLIAVAVPSTPHASTEVAMLSGLDTSAIMSESRMLASEAWDAF